MGYAQSLYYSLLVRVRKTLAPENNPAVLCALDSRLKNLPGRLGRRNIVRVVTLNAVNLLINYGHFHHHTIELTESTTYQQPDSS